MQDRILEGSLPNSLEASANQQKQFDGQTVMVTGGSSGIGAEICREFARQGAARIILVSRHQGLRAEQMEDELKAMGAAVTRIPADLSTPRFSEGIVKRLKGDGIRQVHVLVNNAGMVDEGINKSTKKTNRAKIMDTNYRAAVLLSRDLLAQLIPDSGTIVNISSTAGVYGDRIQPIYSESKAALLDMTKRLAKELRARNIRVNAIAPGFVDSTGMTTDLPQVGKDVIAQETPGGKLVTTMEVAQEVARIANPNCTVTGETVIVDKGVGERTPEVLEIAFKAVRKAMMDEARANRRSQTAGQPVS